jgi:hypothetical protein
VAALLLQDLWAAKNQSLTTTADASLAAVRDAIVGNAAGPGYVADTDGLPATLRDLFIKPAGGAAFDPQTARGWRGPYLSSPTTGYAVDAARQFTYAYGKAGDPAPADSWGQPIVLQVPTAAATPADRKTYARLVSAGPDGILQTPADVLYPMPTTRGDDLVVFLYRPDVAP